MKVRITDLMGLYEDEHCSLSPTEEQNERAADPGARMEITEEVNEVKQSKHRFGWKEGLSLAAALALVVLGGFGVKKLLARGIDPQQDSPGAQSSQTAAKETRAPTGMEPLYGAEREEINRFLTVFAQQGIENLDTDLDQDAELIRFAFIYRRIYDPESISVLPDGDQLTDTLRPEQVNETLTRLLGKTVTPDENANYDLLRSEPVGGHCSYHDGCFWQEPSGNDHLLRFALAEERHCGGGTLFFTVYAVDILYWPDAELEPLPALSQAETEALVREGKLKPLFYGAALVEQTGDGYRLLSYEAEPLPPSTEPDPPEETYSVDPTRVNALLTAFAEQGITDSGLDLAGEYELAQFAHIYTKLHEREAIRYQSADGESWETLTLEQVNETLTRLLGKTLSPAEGTDYTAQRGENYAQHESYHDGCFWWPAADGETHPDFAVFADNHRYTLVGHGTEELPFLLLEVIPEAWPDWESAALSELNTEDIMALIKAGKLEMLSSSGRATIRWEGAEPVMQSFQVNYPNRASYVLDSLLCARQTDPDGLDSVREIQLMRDGSFRYRERKQDSDYSYWCKGSWRMLRNGMRLDYSETDALWSDTQAAAQYAVYAIDYDESGFHMTLVEGAGLGRDQIGWYVRYNAAPDVEPDDSDEDLHVDVTTSD